jgi:hypothetical protein
MSASAESSTHRTGKLALATVEQVSEDSGSDDGHKRYWDDNKTHKLRRVVGLCEADRE